MNRKLTLQFICLMCLPIIYTASIGPVLLLAEKVDADRNTYWRALYCYRPMLTCARFVRADRPLAAYLRKFNLQTVRIAGRNGSADSLSVIPASYTY